MLICMYKCMKVAYQYKLCTFGNRNKDDWDQSTITHQYRSRHFDTWYSRHRNLSGRKNRPLGEEAVHLRSHISPKLVQNVALCLNPWSLVCFTPNNSTTPNEQLERAVQPSNVDKEHRDVTKWPVSLYL
jgi:hypothetical protein